ncbi:MAG: sortase [Candidatus Shapirobacteria bacterium]|nr:sortase [Candidatus Shapirobacteria bacterium]
MIEFFKITPKKRKVKIKSGSGIIYSNPSGFKRFLFYFGNCLFVLSFIYFVYLYWPLSVSLVKYKLALNSFNPQKAETVIYSAPIIDSKVFNIQIPKILATADVVPNVSPFDQNEYMNVLKNNVVAHAKSTAFPGDGKGKSIYIFAHSSGQGVGGARNNPVFYLLGQLKNDDEVFVNFKGQVFTYRVYEQKIAKPSDIEYLAYKDNEKEVLILQTCWPIGTDWNRLLVFTQRVK